jgi:phage-related tail fiber protein
MATFDIRSTVVGETALAIKAPCLVATTGASINLTGVQTIDGVMVGNNSERVLVKDQTNQTQNGIYIAQTGNWLLAADFTSNNNVALGTMVLIASGAVNGMHLYVQTCTDNPITVGTSLIAFARLL